MTGTGGEELSSNDDEEGEVANWATGLGLVMLLAVGEPGRVRAGMNGGARRGEGAAATAVVVVADGDIAPSCCC